jgi:hypothetical protein
MAKYRKRSGREKKLCGHEVRYRCTCHRNAERFHGHEAEDAELDTVDLMQQPVGRRIVRGTDG